MSIEDKQLLSEKLVGFGVYLEQAFDSDWCFKYQFPGQDVIIVSHKEKEKAASKFFIEYLKSLHYSIRYLYEDNRMDQLKSLLDKMKLLSDENVNKTVEIVTRSMKLSFET